jgi:hypothetical protein
MWQSAKWHLVGLGDAHVALGGAGLWVQVALPRPLASLVHICHHFGLFLPYFLHRNNYTSTSEIR